MDAAALTNLTVSRAGSTPAKRDAHALYRQMEAEGIGASSFSDLYVRGEAPAPPVETPQQAPMPASPPPAVIEAEAPAAVPSQTFEVPAPAETSQPAAPALSSQDWYRLMENQGLGWAGTNDLVVPSQTSPAPSTLTELDVPTQPDAPLPPVATLPEVPVAPPPVAPPAEEALPPVATLPEVPVAPPPVAEPVAPPVEETVVSPPVTPQPASEPITLPAEEAKRPEAPAEPVAAGGPSAKKSPQEWYREMEQSGLGSASLNDLVVPAPPRPTPAEPIEPPVAPTNTPAAPQDPYHGFDPHGADQPQAPQKPTGPGPAPEPPVAPTDPYQGFDMHGSGQPEPPRPQPVEPTRPQGPAEGDDPYMFFGFDPAAKPESAPAQPEPQVDLGAIPTPPPLPPVPPQANPQQSATAPDDHYLFFGFDPNATGGPAQSPATQPTPPNVPPMPGPMPGVPNQAGPAARDPYAPYSYNSPQGFGPGQTFTPGYGRQQSPPNWGYYDSFGQPNPYPNQPADPYAAYGFNPYGAAQGPMTMPGPWMSPAPCFPPAYPMWSTMPAWMMLGAGMTSIFALSMMCGGWGWGGWL